MAVISDITLNRNKNLFLEMKELSSTEIPSEIPANEDIENIDKIYENIPKVHSNMMQGACI